MEFRIFTSADSEEFAPVYELFRSIFTDPDEAEDLEGIKTSLSLVGDSALVARYGSFREYWIGAAEDGKPVGGVNFTAFEVGDRGITTAHINYLFVSAACRGRGTGSLLLEKVREISMADFIFCEQNDPELMSDEALAMDRQGSGIGARERIEWWRKRGFAKLDMRYVQPPLSEDKMAAENMSLNVCPAPPSLDARIVEAHLRRFYYISVLKSRTAESNPAVEKILEDVLGKGSIGTIPG